MIFFHAFCTIYSRRNIFYKFVTIIYIIQSERLPFKGSLFIQHTLDISVHILYTIYIMLSSIFFIHFFLFYKSLSKSDIRNIPKLSSIITNGFSSNPWFKIINIPLNLSSIILNSHVSR